MGAKNFAGLRIIMVQYLHRIILDYAGKMDHIKFLV